MISAKTAKKLFEGLEIAKHQTLCDEWMNQYPTIFVSFRQVDGLDFTGAYDMLTWVISELYKKHLYLLESDRINECDKEIARQLIWGNASLKGYERKSAAAHKTIAAILWKTCDSS